MYDCLTCGACCHGLDVYLTEEDQDRFVGDPQLGRYIREHPWRGRFPLIFLRRDAEHDRCLALEVRGERVRCTIYPDRPYLCHELAVGSDGCEEARRKKGLPVDSAPRPDEV